MSSSISTSFNGTDQMKQAGIIGQKGFILTWLIVGVGVAVSCLVLYSSPYPFQLLSSSAYRDASINPYMKSSRTVDYKLQAVLRNAAMKDNTVIVTTLNKAWAEPNSIFDVFLKSFRIGYGTKGLLKHLVVITLDSDAHARCKATHSNCYALDTSGLDFSGSEAYFMTPVYLEMMWIRIRLLTDVLEMGHNFVFTDVDVMWLQNPFKRFYTDGDFQIACDNFYGNPDDMSNMPNGGFTYVRSNNKTIPFYNYWYAARKDHPGLHDQDVFNKIKNDPFITNLTMKVKFLDTAYFGGFCEVSKDFNLACTMHANCCYGLESKVKDLKLVLKDWKSFTKLTPKEKEEKKSTWSVPRHCSLDDFHPPDLPKKQGNSS